MSPLTEPRKATSYTPEFRESVVQLPLTSNRPMAQTAQELGLSKDTLYGWVLQAKAQRPRRRSIQFKRN
ncbi:transposase [Methylocaldum szegediense]|uniref:transposase n=1 Tax=Methylocaldum szegediense TaxID=73780 RepID=UPI00399D7381